MPRQPRLDAPGLLQHVIARGIERREIFKDDKDRKVPEVGDRKSEVRCLRITQLDSNVPHYVPHYETGSDIFDKVVHGINKRRDR